MKIISLIFTLLIAFTFSSYSWTFYRSAENGKKDGYYNTDQGKWEAGYNDVSTYLVDTIVICDDPGDEGFPGGKGDSISPIGTNGNAAKDHAFEQIELGNLSGSALLFGNVNVERTATGSDQTDDTLVLVWETGETKPDGNPPTGGI